jgi:hypothetical protein
MSERPESTFNTDEPIGHEPMDYKDGRWYLPGNELAQLDFNIGPEKHNRAVFKEYERTFGRGFAYDVTHRTRQNSIYKNERKNIEEKREEEILSEYNRLRGATVFFSDKEKSDRMIEELRNFRRSYPELYIDVSSNSDAEEVFNIIN